MNYCPRCATPLEKRADGGRERPACPAEDCRFIHFGHFSIGCGAVVIRGNKALLIQRGLNPNRGDWQIPGGYVEADEVIVDAVEREVLEESGITARVTDVIGLRHAAGPPTANIYVVFRLQVISGEPVYDGHETIGAGYFSLEEMAQMERVQALSIWAIQQALKTPVGSGFKPDPTSPAALIGPGRSLFGLAS